MKTTTRHTGTAAVLAMIAMALIVALSALMPAHTAFADDGEDEGTPITVASITTPDGTLAAMAIAGSNGPLVVQSNDRTMLMSSALVAQSSGFSHAVISMSGNQQKNNTYISDTATALSGTVGVDLVTGWGDINTLTANDDDNYYIYGVRFSISGGGLSGGITYGLGLKIGDSTSWSTGSNGSAAGGNSPANEFYIELTGEYKEAYTIKYQLHGHNYGASGQTSTDGTVIYTEGRSIYDFSWSDHAAIDGIGMQLLPKDMGYKIYTRYQNSSGGWGGWSAEVSGTAKFGKWIDSWARGEDDTYYRAYVDGIYAKLTKNNDRYVSVYRKQSYNKIMVRYETATGGWSAYADGSGGSGYSTAREGNLYVGQTTSWSRAADSTYQAASASITATKDGQTKYVSVYRKTAVNKIMVRYETATGGWTANADGTGGSGYSTASSGTDRVGYVRSWSRAADSTYQAASASITGTASNQTKYVSVYRKTAVNKIMVRYETATGGWTANADGTGGSGYSTASSGTDRVGYVRSWSRAADSTYQAASASITGTASNQTKYVNVYRKTAFNQILVRYEQWDGSWAANADGTGSGYTTVSSGYDRVGATRAWSRAADATYDATSASITGTASAQTKYVNVTRKSYTATFDAHGGTSCASITRKVGAPLGTLPETTRDRWVFKGWFTAETDGTQISADTRMGTSNVTYHAHWNPTVRYVVDDDAALVAAIDEVENGTAFTVPAARTSAATRPSCTSFDGWYTNSGYGNAWIDGTAVSEPVTLYARNWATVTYLNGAASKPDVLYFNGEREGTIEVVSETPEPALFAYGKVANLAELKNENRRVQFAGGQQFPSTLRAEMGWHVGADGEGNAVASIVIDGDASVYKTWVASVYDGIDSSRR